MHRAVFLDRDGTITAGVPKYERVDSVDKVEILPTVIEALTKLANSDYLVFFVTNQAGMAEGLIDQAGFDAINYTVLQKIEPSGIHIEKTYVCPHGDTDKCDCRKPKPTLLLEAARTYDIDLSQSWMVGDRTSDVLTGVNAGTRTVLVRSGVPDVDSDQASATVDNLLQAIEYIRDHS